MKSVKFDARNFKCPITGKVIKNPVVGPNGVTYEQNAIEALLDSKKAIPQYSGRNPTKDDLIPNYAFKSLLDVPEVAQQFKENKPEILIKESDMPECPILMDAAFEKPVLADDGYTYDEKALKKYMSSSGSNSPMTRAPIVQPLRANKFVEALTEEYKKQNKVELEKENQESEKLVAEQSKFAPESEMEVSPNQDGRLGAYEAFHLASLLYSRPMMISYSLPQFTFVLNDNRMFFGTSMQIECCSVLSSPYGNALFIAPQLSLLVIAMAEVTMMPFATNHFKYQQMIEQQQDESRLVVGF